MAKELLISFYKQTKKTPPQTKKLFKLTVNGTRKTSENLREIPKLLTLTEKIHFQHFSLVQAVSSILFVLSSLLSIKINASSSCVLKGETPKYAAFSACILALTLQMNYIEHTTCTGKHAEISQHYSS